MGGKDSEKDVSKFTGDASTRKGGGGGAIYTTLYDTLHPFENLWHRRCGGNTLPDNGWSEYAKQVQILPDATLRRLIWDIRKHLKSHVVK